MAFPSVPAFDKLPGLKMFLEGVGRYVDKELRSRTPDITAKGSVILVAPDGSTWEVKVSDLGVLSTTQRTA